MAVSLKKWRVIWGQYCGVLSGYMPSPAVPVRTRQWLLYERLGRDSVEMRAVSLPTSCLNLTLWDSSAPRGTLMITVSHCHSFSFLLHHQSPAFSIKSRWRVFSILCPESFEDCSIRLAETCCRNSSTSGHSVIYLSCVFTWVENGLCRFGF